GLLPFCLLEDFEFWVCDELSLLTGYQRPQAAARTLRPFRVYVHLVHTAEGPGLAAEASALIRRVPLKPRKQASRRAAAAASSSSSSSSSRGFEEAEEDPAAPAETLVNLLLAPEESPLAHVRESLLRVEALSHILVWTQAARGPRGPHDVEALSCEGGDIDAIELPR
ncbi:EF hand domain-containing protein, putative, partial [Eimeria tenella]